MAESEPSTVITAASKLGNTVVRSLAPQFLALVLINVMFMGVFVWYLDTRANHAAEVIRQLLAACLGGKP